MSILRSSYRKGNINPELIDKFLIFARVSSALPNMHARKDLSSRPHSSNFLVSVCTKHNSLEFSSEMHYINLVQCSAIRNRSVNTSSFRFKTKQLMNCMALNSTPIVLNTNSLQKKERNRLSASLLMAFAFLVETSNCDQYLLGKLNLLDRKLEAQLSHSFRRFA